MLEGMQKKEKGDSPQKRDRLLFQPWHLYILRCADGTLYTGITNNLERRLKMHNDGKERDTSFEASSELTFESWPMHARLTLNSYGETEKEAIEGLKEAYLKINEKIIDWNNLNIEYVDCLGKKVNG